MCSVRPWSLLVSFLVGIEVSGQWQLMPTPTSAQLYSVHGTPGNILAGGTGFLLRSADNGATWDSLPIFFQPGQVLTTLQVFDIHDRGSGVHFICGYDLSSGTNNLIWRSNNAGTSWSLVYAGPGGLLPTLYALDFDAGNIGLAAGTPGRVVRTANGGGSWQDALNTTNAFRDVAFDPLQAGRAVAVGEGEIVRATVNAQNWSATTAPNAAYRGVQFIGPNTALAVGMGGTVVRSTNGGSNWSTLTTYLPGPLDLFDLHFINDQEGYVLANDRILRTTNGGVHWEWFPLEGPMNALHFVSPTEGYAVGQGGRVYRMVPGGAYHPVAVFNGPASACPGVPVSFTNMSAPGLSLQWLVDGVPAGTGGTLDWTFTEPVQQPTVALVVSNGAFTDTLEQVVSVGQTPETPIEAVAQSSLLCAGQSTQVVVSNSIMGGTYRLRRGTTVIGAAQAGNGGTLTFSTGAITIAFDTLNIQVTRNLVGCGIVTAELEIPLQLDLPQVDLPVATSTPVVCENDQAIVAVQGTEAGLSYQLRLGSSDVGPPQIGTGGELLFNTGPIGSDGVHTVRVTTALGCVDQLDQSVPITVQIPEAIWGPTSLNPVVGASVDMMNASVSYGGSFLWDFGPEATPATSSLDEPIGVVFNSSGQYDVSLTVTTPIGCTTTYSRVIQAIPQPPTQACSVSQVDLNSGNPDGTAVHMDAAGNIHGIFDISNAPDMLITSGGPDSLALDVSAGGEQEATALLVKYDAQGVLQWYVRVLKEGDAGVSDLITDDEGNLYMAVSLGSVVPITVVDASGARATGSNLGMQVLSTTPQGRLRWIAATGQSAGNEDMNIALDGQGHVIVQTTSRLSQFDRATGELIYSDFLSFGYRDITVLPNDHILVTERFNMVLREHANDGTVLGSTSPVFATPPPFGLTRLNGWITRLGPDGSLYQLHNVMGQVIIGTDTLVGSGSVEPDVLNTYFFVKRSPDGEVLWLRSFHMNSTIRLQGMELSEDRLFLSVHFEVDDTLHMDGLAPIPFDGWDSWLLSYDLDGGTPFAKRIYAHGGLPLDLNHPVGRNSLALSTDGERLAMQVPLRAPVVVGTDTAFAYTSWIDPLPSGSQHVALVLGDVDCVAPPSTALPQALFEAPANNCAGQPIAFVDASLNVPTAWSWSFPGGSPATSTDPAVEVTYALPGTYPVTLTVSNANGESAPFVSEVFVDVCTGVAAAVHGAGFSVHPNPASTEIRIAGPHDGPFPARFLDVQGKVVWQGQVITGKPIHIGDRPEGMLVLELVTATGIQRLPFLVVR